MTTTGLRQPRQDSYQVGGATVGIELEKVGEISNMFDISPLILTSTVNIAPDP